MAKKYGEFNCPYCDATFFIKKMLDGHIGGKHKRNVTKDNKPKCKFCNTQLKEGVNWPEWAVKQRNLICVQCKRKQNRKSYRNRTKIKQDKFATLKEKLQCR